MSANNSKNRSKFLGICNITKLRSLIQRGHNIDVPDRAGRTILMNAAAKGLQACVGFCLKSGADVKRLDSTGNGPLHYASSGKANINIVANLIRSGAAINRRNKDMYTPLLLASGRGHVGIVKLLLRTGANPNLCNRRKESPLAFACSWGKTMCVREILAKGGSVDKKDVEGVTPLMIAAQRANRRLVQMLLKYGADVDAVDNRKNSVLIHALWGGNLAIIKDIWKRGCFSHRKKNYPN